jgi:uncharacterized SAM-binding protein YcdF (DUF218 family)
MFFVLSKIFSFILYPFTWVVSLFFWYALSKSKNKKRKIGIVIIVTALVFSNDFIYTKVLFAYQSSPQQLSKKQFSAGILLGGMAGVNNEGYWHFGKGVERFIAAEELYHQGIINKIIVSGGSGELLQQQFKEAPYLKDELIASGIKDSDIIIEPNSRNTFENAIFSKHIIDSLRLSPPYLLITSALHMPRSIKIFNKANIDTTPYPCYFSIEASKNIFEIIFIPNIRRLYDWNFIFREWMGVAVYKLTGKI